MANYIMLLNYTDQGIANVKESPKRLDTAKELATRFGAELKEFFLTLGNYDAVVILEAPSDEAASKFALAAGSLGNVRTTTLRAYTEPEFRDIIGALP